MTEMVWFLDCYTHEWNAEVVGDEIVLDKTFFYPESGGQPSDFGIIECNGQKFNVLSSRKSDKGVFHKVDAEGLKIGDAVGCVVDWQRRYTLMRYHTACHILSRIIFNETDAMVTGKQIYIDRARIDFSLKDFNKELVKQYEENANQAIENGYNVRWLIMSRDEANKINDLVRLQNKPLPESMNTVRVVDIAGLDVQACGGTHVRNTKEIGRIKVTKIDNKGKENRRIEFILL